MFVFTAGVQLIVLCMLTGIAYSPAKHVCIHHRCSVDRSVDVIGIACSPAKQVSSTAYCPAQQGLHS
jgi:hypothetical protein